MNTDVLFQQAVRNHQAGRLVEALAGYRQVLAGSPQHFRALNQLGVLMGQTGKLDEAINLLERAVRTKPDYVEALSNLGKALADVDRTDEAVGYCERAIALKSDYPKAHYNLGVALVPTGQIERARASFERAVTLKSDYANAHYNLALAQLLLGDFARGWREYEWRWRVPGLFPPRQLRPPQWTGSAFGPGETILLHAEQGFGDTIQFVRFAPLVRARGASRIIVECPAELAPLIESNSAHLGIDQVLASQKSSVPIPLPPFDLHSPLMSLPDALGGEFASTLAACPVPYLKADPDLSERWNKRLGDHSTMRVGLVWAGRPAHKNDRNRSIPLSQLVAPLAPVQDVTFYSLQKGEAAAQVASSLVDLVDLTAELTDFAQTAAMIEHLDLVITVDTAVAHLAAAIGKPVWALLPFVPDWRWLLARDDSPWYPSMRLLRQTSKGDWSSLLHSIGRELRSFTP